jgi:hypothetical protein
VLRYQITRPTDRRTTKTGNKYDREWLKRTEVKREYVSKLVTRVEESDKDNIDWQTLQQIITNTADEVIGKIEIVERNEWYDDECKEATKSKNEAYCRMVQKYYTRGAEEQYKEIRRIEKRILRKKRGGSVKNKTS